MTVLSCLTGLLALSTSFDVLPCPREFGGQPRLGEQRIVTGIDEPKLVRVQQRDLDVSIVVRTGTQQSVHDGPGHRNAAEWIYLESPSATAATEHQLCIYAIYRSTAAPAYDIQVSAVPAAFRDSYRAISNAGVAWATGTRESRLAAIAGYELVAARSHTELGLSDHARLYAALALIQRYQFDAALAHLDRLFARSAQSGYLRYSAHAAIGAIHNRRGNFAASKAALDKALAQARTYQQRSGRSLRRDIAEMTNLLGEVQLSAGEIDSGRRSIDRAATLAADDDQLLGLIHNNLGYYYLLQADRDPAEARPKHLARSIEEHRRARDHADRAGDRLEQSIIDNNLATLFERIGDVSNARRHFEAALQAIDGTDDPFRFNMLYRGLGHIYLVLGDYEKSERFLTAALSIADQARDSRSVRVYCQLGIARRHRGHLSEAISAHETCRDRARAEGDIRVHAEALYELTIDHSLNGAPDGAWAAIREGVDLLPRLHDADAKSNVLIQYALMLQRRGQVSDARSTIRAAIAVAQRARYPATLVDALAAAMTIHREQGQGEAAEKFGLATLDAIESVHAHLDPERLGPAWSAKTRDIYAELAILLLTKGDDAHLAAAFDVIERSRAISLRQRFSAPRSVVQPISDNSMLTALSELANVSAAPSEHARQLPLAYYHEHDLLTLSRLTGAAEQPVPRPLAVSTIAKSLQAGQLALSYFFSSQRLHLFVIGDDGFAVLDLASRGEIERLIDDTRRAIDQKRGDLTAKLSALSRVLVPDSLPPATEWIVVRDGPLLGVPFNALHIGGSKSSYTPAVARLAVKIVPSLSLYLTRKPALAANHSIDLAVLADPDFKGARVATTGHEPTPTSWTQSLQRLPWTAREVKQLAALFPPQRTLIYTDTRANRDNLRSEATRNARMLHIASHGYFDSGNPDNVGFALAPTRVGGQLDSGFITLTELFSYRFNNDLVVISGCDTAIGLERGGEGMMSLTRGFIAQGASHVISTLWPVSDRASADLMNLFYNQLLSGAPVAQALRNAQSELRSQPRYRDPLFWGAYMLTTTTPDDRMVFAHRTTARRS
jgi:tetratricopeptide (TPR) repeat protein